MAFFIGLGLLRFVSGWSARVENAILPSAVTFTYYYKTSDGIRHEAEIGAPSRDEAFAALRERGIRPIKLIARDGSSANGEMRGVRKRVVAALVVTAVVVAGAAAFLLGRRAPAVPEVVVTPQGPVKFSVASALPRQRIPGDRLRIERQPTNLFAFASEAVLAGFAEPGRPLPAGTGLDEADVRAALAKPVMLSSADFTEHVDLKRIVVGMKRELGAYLAGGGTVDGYAGELVKRQKMEIAYREKAEKHLADLLAPSSEAPGPSARSANRPVDQSNNLSSAYAYWLKANASLQAMGIYPLELPEVLRSYQLTLDIDDAEGVPTLESRTVESPPVALPKR